MKAPPAILLCWLIFLSGCGLYFKSDRFKDQFPLTEGMSEGDLLAQWGSPLSVQVLGPAQVWKYFSVQPPPYGKKKEYWLVWFQDGRLIKWEKKEEENISAGTGL